MSLDDVVIVGCGIFGVTAARELQHRGYRVRVLDPGPLPHPLAASTDISKVVRMEYGSDRAMMRWVDQAIAGWHAWNDELEAEVYRQTGILALTRRPLEEADYEHESFRSLLAEGHSPERLDSGDLVRRYPQWNADVYLDGFFNARAGYADSGRTVTLWIDRAREEGVLIEDGRKVVALERERGRITAARDENGKRFEADHFVICAGAWTQELVRELEPHMCATGHPVFHVRPRSIEAFSPPEFPVFNAEIATSGWYGFPYQASAGVLKIANHGAGVALDPHLGRRHVSEDQISYLRAFLTESLPQLGDAELVGTRLCLYHDTRDGQFWIDRHPDVANLTIGAGGSGHAFKFAPLLGGWIADAVEGSDNTSLDRFRWRNLAPGTRGEEEARCHDS